MSFRQLEVQTQAAPLNSGIGATLSKRGPGKARLSITFSEAVVGKANLQANEIIVMLGEGNDHGLLRLRYKRDGETGIVLDKKSSPKSEGHYYKLPLGHIPQFVDRAEPKRWCQWELLGGPLSEGLIEIVLPSWADETNPVKRKPETVRAPISLQATKPHAVPINGDPPAGRSALDKRPEQKLEDICDRYVLTTIEGKLLIALSKAPIVSREDLETFVWGDKQTDSTKLATLLNLLRGKIGRLGFEIINSRGFGWGLDKEARSVVQSLLGDVAA